MPPHPRVAVVLAGAGFFFAVPLALAATDRPPALRSVNPDLLSGGLFSALDAEGAFGARPPPSRARASVPDLSKGKPPAVLDARVGVNLRLGDDPAALPAGQRGQAEPHIYRSAINPDVLLATFQEGRYTDGGSLDCGYSVSRDGGLTWTRALIPSLTTASGGSFNRATDPVAAIGPQGEMYLNTLGSISGVFDLGAVVVSRSTDDGATWTAPLTVFQSPNAQTMPDKNWLAVNDYAGAPNSGRLVATWTNFTFAANGAQTGDNIVAAVSDDRGSTWTAPIAVTPAGSLNQGSQPVFLTDGSLVLVYVTFASSTANFTIQCKRSTDGGLTYPAAATTIAGVVAWDDPDLRDGVFLPSAIVARGTDDILVTYTAVVNGSPRVMFTKSSDKGATWTTPIAISDQPAGVSVMNPAIVVTPDGGTVSAVWMDKRNASDGHNFVDHYAAMSFDGGATWQPNVRLTETSSDIRYAASTTRGYMLGDYLGVAPSLASDQPCVAIWCDTRTGDADPFTVRFAPTAVSSFNAWRVARFSRSELADASRSGPFADFDGDGVPNLAEYFHQTNPRVSESGSLFAVAKSGASASISYRYRLDFGGGVNVRWEHSLDGVSWSIAPHQTVPNDFSRPTDNTGTEIFPIVAGHAEFFREVFAAHADFSVSTWPEIIGINTDSRLVNLSTRGRVGVDASQMIVGFVVDGGKSVLLRAAGPALATFGVRGTLADPQLALRIGATVVAGNDNWSSGNATTALFSRLGAFPFAAGSLDAALVAQVSPQGYTALASGANAGTGIALVEAYDADARPGAPTNPRLVNLSTRASAGAGDDALIAGFSLSGTQPRRVLVRAVGPTLASFGLTGVLADPVLTLYRGSTAIASDDDWEISCSGAAIAATAQRVGAFALNSASLDAALLLTLAPGSYTAVVTSADGATGLALIEVYDAD